MGVLATGAPAGAESPAHVTANFTRLTGAHATPYSYGLNGFKSFDPQTAGTPGNDAYKAGVDFMHPGFLRMHSWNMYADSSTSGEGWFTNFKGAAAWDRTRIGNAFDGSYAYGPVRMLNIPQWPPAMDLSGKLDPRRVNDFAALCADLVRAVNVEQQRKVLYWEVTNERDGTYAGSEGDLATLILAAATAMRAVDPTIKVGGPAFAQPYQSANVDAFMAVARDGLDFVSYHTYSTGNASDTNASVWDSAQNGVGGATTLVKGIVAKYTTKPVELFHNEYNISYNPPDAKMTNEVGAVYDALAMIGSVNAGATGTAAWNEADGWYGKLDATFNKRPAAYVFQILNSAFVGNVAATTSDDKTLVPFAVTSNGEHALLLVHRDDSGPVTGSVAWTGDAAASLMVSQVTATGLSTSVTTASALSAGLTLPASSVTAITAMVAAIGLDAGEDGGGMDAGSGAGATGVDASMSTSSPDGSIAVGAAAPPSATGAAAGPSAAGTGESGGCTLARSPERTSFWPLFGLAAMAAWRRRATSRSSRFSDDPRARPLKERG